MAENVAPLAPDEQHKISMKKWDQYSASYTTLEAMDGQTRSSIRHKSKIGVKNASNQPRQTYSR